jgi:hypothetical protein
MSKVGHDHLITLTCCPTLSTASAPDRKVASRNKPLMHAPPEPSTFTAALEREATAAEPESGTTTHPLLESLGVKNHHLLLFCSLTTAVEALSCNIRALFKTDNKRNASSQAQCSSKVDRSSFNMTC